MRELEYVATVIIYKNYREQPILDAKSDVDETSSFLVFYMHNYVFIFLSFLKLLNEAVLS